VNATRLSPEDDWQSCDEFYSDAEENARSLIHAGDVSLTDVRGSSRLIVSFGCAIRSSKTTELAGETRLARGTYYIQRLSEKQRRGIVAETHFSAACAAPP